MEYQVLSIEQMTKLEAMGIDTSDASCMWTSVQDEDYLPIYWLVTWRGPEAKTIEEMREVFPLTFKKGNAYYAYTLQDVLNKLGPFFRKKVITTISGDWLNLAFEYLVLQTELKH